jgi:hypothetical protein
MLDFSTVGWGIVSTLIALLVPLSFVEVFLTKVEFDDLYICKTWFFWKRTMLWDEVAEWTYSASFNIYILKTRGGKCIWISEFYSGLEPFLKRLERT